MIARRNWRGGIWSVLCFQGRKRTALLNVRSTELIEDFDAEIAKLLKDWDGLTWLEIWGKYMARAS